MRWKRGKGRCDLPPATADYVSSVAKMIGAATALLATTIASPAMAASLLNPLFADHAVLQREAPIPVYGEAEPGADVTVTLGNSSARAKADETGAWQAVLPAMGAGGPYVLQARSGGAEQAVQDVLVGDVFLCSGQSNMAFKVQGADSAAAAIRSAQDSAIRSLTVATKASVEPLSTFADPVSWLPAAPETVGDFSAACYFFARQLKETTQTPIGMVVAAWGGSRVRAWTSESALRSTGLYDRQLDLLNRYAADPREGIADWVDYWEEWWHGLNIAGAPPWEPDFDDSGWKTAPEGLGPWALWEGDSPDGFVGQMWLRTTVTLSAEQAARSAILDLGTANEEDETWVNGHGVGGNSFVPDSRHEIPAGVLHAGTNTITTNIFCSWRNCGLTGPADARAIRFDDGSTVPLDGPWRYREMPAQYAAPQLPWGPAHGTSVIYNGMIAPMGPYAFRAAIWYQGESDIRYADKYQANLAAMMADWRTKFGADLPFLIVQLPDFGPIPTQPVDSPYANVREAQRRAADADPRADYITTIDVGDPADIHPTNKDVVGARLASAMRRLAYGEDTPTGPRPASVQAAQGGVRVAFTGVTDALVSYSGAPNAFELCGPTTESCRFVPARIDGAEAVWLDSTKGPANPTRVRYCWGESPVCTLSDASALPATPFEMPIAQQ